MRSFGACCWGVAGLLCCVMAIVEQGAHFFNWMQLAMLNFIASEVKYFRESK